MSRVLRRTEGAGSRRLASIGPRILPFTIVAMAALLVVKLVGLTLVWLPEGTTRSLAQSAATMFGAAHAAEGSKPEAAKTEPTKAEPAKAEPNKIEASKTETAKAEPAKAEPGKAEPGKAEPGKEEPSPTAFAPGATAGSAARPIGEVSAALGPGLSESERGLLTDLRTRRQELDKREAALSERANVLTAAEGRLAARLDELKALQARLESLEKARQVQTDANWRGLVKVYEDMKPRDAAAICNDLDSDVLISVLDRMKDAKTASLLAAMDPAKAREATALLAKRRAQATALPPAAPASAPPISAPSAAKPVATPAVAQPAPAAASPPAAGRAPAPPGAAEPPPPAAGAGKGAEAAPPMRRTSL